MTKERASLGFGDELDEFDPTEWNPDPTKTANDKPKAADTKAAADAAGFQSREPAKAKPATQQRRRRTGRNVQLNMKARQDTIDAYVAIADGQGWGLGETLEHAVTLLQEKYGKG
ncbi:MAG: hypothetical protein ABJF05_22255 [Paracoccaceae bacterium]